MIPETTLRAGRSGVRIPVAERDFFPLSKTYRTALRPTQCCTSWVPGSFPEGVMLTTLFHLASRLWKSFVIRLSVPHISLHDVEKWNFTVRLSITITQMLTTRLLTGTAAVTWWTMSLRPYPEEASSIFLRTVGSKYPPHCTTHCSSYSPSRSANWFNYFIFHFCLLLYAPPPLPLTYATHTRHDDTRPAAHYRGLWPCNEDTCL